MPSKMLSKVLRTLSSLTSSPTKLALVVRGDLKMSRGKTAAQTAHAAVLCFTETQQDQSKKNLLNSWCVKGQPKIVLRVDTYTDLLQLEEKAKKAGITTAMVRDAGRTQLNAGTATVLGIGPDTVDRVDKLVANLKLL